MKSSTSPKAPAKLPVFILNRERGERISAVEGMALSERMRVILDHADEAALTGEERRSLIKERLKRG